MKSGEKELRYMELWKEMEQVFMQCVQYGWRENAFKGQEHSMEFGI